jgi:hypothetical protein
VHAEFPRNLFLEGKMHIIQEAPARAVPEAHSNFAMNLIAMICGLGIVVFVCLATSGLDMSPGFF